MAASTWLTARPDGCRILWTSVAPTDWEVDETNIGALRDVLDSWGSRHPEFVMEVWGRTANMGAQVMMLSQRGIAETRDLLLPGAEEMRGLLAGLAVALEVTYRTPQTEAAARSRYWKNLQQVKRAAPRASTVMPGHFRPIGEPSVWAEIDRAEKAAGGFVDRAEEYATQMINELGGFRPID